MLGMCHLHVLFATKRTPALVANANNTNKFASNKSIKNKGDMDLVQKIDTYAPMLRNSHPPPPNNNPGRNGNDFGTHGNNWNAFSNPTDSLNAKNIKQEHTFYGNTDDQMLNDRTGMNRSSSGTLPKETSSTNDNSSVAQKMSRKASKNSRHCQGQLHLIYNKKLRVQMIIRL